MEKKLKKIKYKDIFTNPMTNLFGCPLMVEVDGKFYKGSPHELRELLKMIEKTEKEYGEREVISIEPRVFSNTAFVDEEYFNAVNMSVEIGIVFKLGDSVWN